MPLPTLTLNQIVRRGLVHFRTAFPGRPLGSKHFFGKTARAVGHMLWGVVHKSIEDLDKDIVPGPHNSTERLSDWAFVFGLPDGEGGYGRLKNVAASGGVASLEGAKGTIYRDGLLATAEDGVTQIQLSGTVTISGTPPGFGSVAAKFVAFTKGTAGNLPVGTVCTWESPPPGAGATFTLTSSDMKGGLDIEKNTEVAVRISELFQAPPRGGAAEDYRRWAETAGARHVFIYPRRSGTGTVDVVVAMEGSGLARIPSASVLADAQRVIDERKPNDVDRVNVLAPSMPVGSGLAIRVRVQPADELHFDWNDTSGFTVASVASGPPCVLTLNEALPASLTEAIDLAKSEGTEEETGPRVQLIATNGPIIPLAPRCVDYNAGAKTLTLDSATPTLLAWVNPSAGDVVFAGGPVVATIAAGVLAYVDSLGPSRESGYADKLSHWDDYLATNDLVALAEEAVSSDGTVMVVEVPPGGATANGAIDDVGRRPDRSRAAPELIWAKSIAITQ